MSQKGANMADTSLSTAPEAIHTALVNSWEPKDMEKYACLITYLLFARRSLTFGELSQMLAYEYASEKEEVDRQQHTRLNVPKLLRKLSCLILIEQGTVCIADEPTRGILLQHKRLQAKLSDNARIHALLANICLQCLLNLEDETESMETHKLSGNFLAYASVNWVWHYQQSGDKGQCLDLTIMHLLSFKASLSDWFKNHREAEKNVEKLRHSLDLEAPLCILSHLGLTALIEKLIISGADVNPSCHHNLTPLRLAARAGHTEAIGILIRAGADLVADQRFKGGSALHHAVLSRSLPALQLLLREDQYDIDTYVKRKDFSSFTPLQNAAIRGYPGIAQELLRCGAKVEHQGNMHDSPLNLALKYYKKERTEDLASTIKVLLNFKADVNNAARPKGKEKSGNMPLILALRTEEIWLVKALLNHGAHVNHVPVAGTTALTIAARRGNIEIMKLLLKFGADADKFGEDFRSPMYSAIDQENSVEMVKLLLQNSANPNLRQNDKEASTLLDLAIRKNDAEVVRVLLAAKVLTRFSVHQTVEYSNKEILELLIDHGANVNSPDPSRHGNSPLHLAVERNAAERLKLLLQVADKLDPKNNEGFTPLHVAIGHENWNLVFLLLKAGADIHALTPRQNSVLHLAVTRDSIRLADIKLLLDAGANPKAMNEIGRLPYLKMPQLRLVPSSSFSRSAIHQKQHDPEPGNSSSLRNEIHAEDMMSPSRKKQKLM